ncbi:MAG TPA: GMP/IMP nucleotidase [Stenotrophobium sp.]|jgi:putative hydrolase of the HAD superfamily|nr:GMP/IMP nucleotidase [Stenotrophobium sp.]
MSGATIDWSAIELVLLDMDGTVLDLAYDNYFWGELLPQRYAQLHELTLEQSRCELAPKFAAVQHTLPWYCTDYWSAQTGLDLAALKRETRHRIGPLAGAVEFLHAVRDSGRQLWLATNAHRDSWTLKLEHTGLAPLFGRIVCSHDFGAPKEDPRFWRALQAQHPFVPAHALFVDDSLPVLRAAREYGIGQVVAISLPDSGQPPREVTEFPAVQRLLMLADGLTGSR